MQFPFPTYGYPTVNTENLNFMSHETHDSDSTLVDVQNGVGGVHMDPFLSAANVLTSFDQGGGMWEAPAGLQSFESDPAFLAGYGAVGPSSAGEHIWDGGDVKGENWDVGDGAKHENWEVVDAGLLAFDALSRANK